MVGTALYFQALDFSFPSFSLINNMILEPLLLHEPFSEIITSLSFTFLGT